MAPGLWNKIKGVFSGIGRGIKKYAPGVLRAATSMFGGPIAGLGQIGANLLENHGWGNNPAALTNNTAVPNGQNNRPNG